MEGILYTIYMRMIYVALMALLSGVFLGSVTVAFFRYMDAKENKEKIKEMMREIIPRPSEVCGEGKTGSTSEWVENLRIDFDKLKERNVDTAGWIVFHKQDVNDPLVQTNDNSYYLNHSFMGEENTTGSIFVDCRNRSFDDRNVVIYGYHGKNRTKFGSLKNVFQGKIWEEENNDLIFLFDTDHNLRKYRIFSYYTVDQNDYYVTTLFRSDAEYAEFLEAVQARSFEKTGVFVTVDDHILTLSTCAGVFRRRRTVVHAKQL